MALEKDNLMESFSIIAVVTVSSFYTIFSGVMTTSSLKLARTTGVFLAAQKMPYMSRDMTGKKMIDSRMSLETMRLINEQLYQKSSKRTKLWIWESQHSHHFRKSPML